jgi:hypothetical protein
MSLTTRGEKEIEYSAVAAVSHTRKAGCWKAVEEGGARARPPAPQGSRADSSLVAFELGAACVEDLLGKSDINKKK